MPIPKTAAVPPPTQPQTPPPPPVTHEAKEVEVTVQVVTAEPLELAAAAGAATLSSQAKVSVIGQDDPVCRANVGSQVTVEECPPPPPKKKQNSCKKHSRCHCDLLSMKVDDFFSVVPE